MKDITKLHSQNNGVKETLLLFLVSVFKRKVQYSIQVYNVLTSHDSFAVQCLSIMLTDTNRLSVILIKVPLALTVFMRLLYFTLSFAEDTIPVVSQNKLSK